jgi:hypothetical protein
MGFTKMIQNKQELTMSTNKEQVKKVYPKRFIDRKDRNKIMELAGNFSRRGHEHVPNWMIHIFILTQLVFVGLMLYFAFMVIQAQQQKTEVLSIIQYMLVSFIIVTSYSLFIVSRLKGTLTATEFMSLFLAKSLESYSSCFCVLNKEGKIIYYNDTFADTFMENDEVESRKYDEVLSKSVFEDKYLEKIEDSIKNSKENSFSLVSSTNNSQTMRNIRIVPLTRPEGIFVLKVITVEIVKSKTKPA